MSFTTGWGSSAVQSSSEYVDKTTDQTITSTKTFTKPPVITTSGNTHVLLINTDTSGNSCDFEVRQNAQPKISMGYNPTTTDAYLWAMNAVDLKIGTNGAERLRIKANGLAVDNTGTPLALAGLPTPPGMLPTTLCLRNDLLSSRGYAAYYLNNPYTCGNLVYVTVPYDTSLATDTGVSNSSGTFTINTTGTYTFAATVDFVLNAAGLRHMYFEYNGSAIKYGLIQSRGNAAFDTVMTSTFTAKLTAGDVIKVKCVQTSGGNLNLVGYTSSGGTAMCMVQITRIS